MLFLDHEEVERFVQITWDMPRLNSEGMGGAGGQADHLGWAMTPTAGEDAARLDYYAASPPRTVEWLQEQDAEAWERAAADVPQDRRGHARPADGGGQGNARAGSPHGSPASPELTREASDRASLFQPMQVAQTVRRPAGAAPSGLAGMVSTGKPGGAALQEIPADAVALTLYLPDRSNTTVHVSEKASAEDVLRAVVSKVDQDPDLAGRLHGATPADCELRMHEGDGEPEDFAIDKNAQICSFGEEEFCVCVAVDRMTAAAAPTAVDFVQEMDGHVAIAFPNGETYTIRIETGWTTTMLLLRLEEKVTKLKQLAQEYVLYVSKEDQVRLRMAPLDGGRLAPDTDVSSLGVSELALERRFFADAPNVNLKRVATSRPTQAPTGGSSQHRPQDLYWRKYNDITAPMWEEWQVHKINQRGKAQRRIMGIGRDNISGQLMVTNAKLDNARRIGDVHTRYRLLTTLLKVDLLAEEMSGLPQTAGGAMSTVRISWNEDGAEYVIKYVADTPDAAMLIVCKILYLREMERKNSAAASKMRRLTTS